LACSVGARSVASPRFVAAFSIASSSFRFARCVRKLPTTLVLLALLGAARPALAEPSSADRATARTLALEGYNALQRKDFATAEERFRRADKLVHAPTLVVDHARALTGLGRLVEAYERYALVVREGVSDNSPWPWKRALQDAEDEIEALKPRLSWLTVAIVGPRTPTVFIDGRRVPSAAVGVPRAVNPGRRVIAARAGGYASREREVNLKEGQQLEIELLLERLPVGVDEEPAPEEPEAPVEEDPQLRPTLPPRTDARRIGTYVAFSAGAAGFIVGGVTGVLALRVRSQELGYCSGDTCVPRDWESNSGASIERYNALRRASTIGFGVGLAALATGTILVLLPRSDANAHGLRSVRPVVGGGPGWGTVELHGRF